MPQLGLPQLRLHALNFAVGAHADHHVDGTVAYPALEHAVGPEYPFGMYFMSWIALCPPLFWCIADPIVDEIERQKAESGVLDASVDGNELQKARCAKAL